ncbi:MAG TPA: MoaD/ThiS family protein [Syntrophobacteraceae bacterium]|nr:MoaD/ThiS family protein [Syntrophobacteraceae bacterium]
MVRVIFKDTEWQIPGNITVRELMTSLGLNPQSVLAVRDGRLVNNETRLGTEGEIRFISVVSGG